MAIDDNRPPYVVYEYQSIEDRAASLVAGHWVGKDVAFATITRPGSRDNLVKEAEVWLKEIKEKGRKGEIPSTWYEAFNGSYQTWKAGETTENINGTPIKGWSVLGNAAQKALISVGILSVEDLASISDSELQNVGTGALSYKIKAKAWLESADKGKATEQIAAQNVKIDELVDLAKKQAEEIARLRAESPKKA